MATDPDAHVKRRLTFDPTINAGHILTFVSLLAALVVGWNTLDKRVVVLEEAKNYQRERDNAQDAAITDKLVEIREGIKDIRRSVDDLRKSQERRP